MTENLCLLISPTAYSKMLYMLGAGNTEVGGFGIITDPEDQFYIGDFQTVKQVCTAASVKFDDEAVADFVEDQIDLKREPWQVMRVWMHTHPGFSPTPSGTDEETFERAFGDPDWAIMLIISKDRKYYARLRMTLKSGSNVEVPVEMRIDYTRDFQAADSAAWRKEYNANILTYWQARACNGARTTRDNVSKTDCGFAPKDRVLLGNSGFRVYGKLDIHGGDGGGYVTFVGDWKYPVTVRWDNGEINFYEPWALEKDEDEVLLLPVEDDTGIGVASADTSVGDTDDPTRSIPLDDIRKAIARPETVKGNKGNGKKPAPKTAVAVTKTKKPAVAKKGGGK